MVRHTGQSAASSGGLPPTPTTGGDQPRAGLPSSPAVFEINQPHIHSPQKEWEHPNK
jgi:hypothetical protein